VKFYFVWSLIIIGLILILVVKLWKKSNMKKKRTNLREVYFYKISFNSSKRLILNDKSNPLRNLNNI
jgi:hypothetical protein